MKKTTIRIGLATLAIVLCTVGDAAARFGRGGGGGGRGGGGMSRGGGGGGFSGGGGMSRPSPSMNRSPAMSSPGASMNRPSTPNMSRPSPGAGSRPGGGISPGAMPRPGSLPSTGARPGGGIANAGTRPGGVGPGAGVGSRPSTGQLNDFLNIPAGGAGRPSTLPANRPGNLGGAMAGGGAAADFLQGGGGRPSTLPATRPGAGAAIANRPGAGAGIADRPGAGAAIANRPNAGTGLTNRPGLSERTGVNDRMTDNRAGRIENRQQYQDNRAGRRDEVRNQVRENHPRLDFWSDHPGWASWRINAPFRWATWGAMAGWVSPRFGWTQAVPYSYGENVYYQDNSVYYGDEPVATAEEYAQQAEAIIASAPEVEPEKADWMPLGVFALTQDGQKTGPDPSLYLQLAISKEGLIAGTLHNTATDITQTVEGLADKETQRVAWAVKDKTRPIMETGIVNLTSDTGPALVHFEDGQTQQWLMVRLDEPAAEKALAAPKTPAVQKAPIPPSPVR